jgi:hypothetical protein
MMASDKRQRIETRIVCEGEDDAWIDALAKKHSKNIPPEPPPPPPRPPLPGWNAAVARMYEFEDTKPLAAMLASAAEPPPHWVCNQLAHLLDPKGGYSVGPDRLVYTRSGRTKAKIKSQSDRFAAGQAVLDGQKEGLNYKDAVKRAAGKKAERKKGYDFSYEKKAVAEVKRLPPHLRPGVRKTP